jgi:hypothetical protein
MSTLVAGDLALRVGRLHLSGAGPAPSVPVYLLLDALVR